MAATQEEEAKGGSVQMHESSEKIDTLAANRTTTYKLKRFTVMFTLVVCAVAWIANFDAGYSGIVLAMPAFNRAFGTCGMFPDPTTGKLTHMCLLSPLQQSLTSVAALFQALGGALAGVTGSRLGRRGTIMIGCIFCIVGAAGMLGTSSSYLNYMVAKAFNAIGIGQLLAAGIIYGAECVPANKRGLLLGLYNIALALGNVCSAAVCAGSASLSPSSHWQWKTPIICQIPLTLFLATGVCLFPESPRWLMVKGKEDEARIAFSKFFDLDPHSAEISAQIEDTRHHLELERQMGATSSWTEIFRGPDLRRTLISAFILTGLAVTGIQFVVPYAALFLSASGIQNPFLINVIVSVCIFAGTFFGPFVIEYGGRRFAMLSGYTGMALCMLIFSAISSGLGATNPTAKKVLVAFLCIWAGIFGGFIGSSVWLSSAEMHSIRLRTYGQASSTTVYQIFAFGAQFWTPYMLGEQYGHMGTNVGYFYFGVTILVVIITFAFVPESSQLTLEQMDDHFVSGKKAWQTSTRANKATNAREMPTV